jgi:hypothetical protein
MINLHLNGDIVRCPDIKLIQECLKEDRERHNICIYNIHENNCATWQNSFACWNTAINKGCSGRCQLSGSDMCQEHQKRIKTGKQEKHFKIDNVNYRKLASASHYLFKTSEHKSIFITLTFPPFKTEYNEKQLNECFSKFMENLRTNYNCSGYVAVREHGENGGRNHFHVVLSIPFVPFYLLVRAWNYAIRDICVSSNNSVSSRSKKIIIKKPASAIRYICKYISKSKGQESKTRIAFISNNLIKKPVQLAYLKCGYRCIADFFDDWNSLTVQQTKYTTMLRFNDNKEFDDFCTKVLYPCFDISDKNQINLSAFPVLNTS